MLNPALEYWRVNGLQEDRLREAEHARLADLARQFNPARRTLLNLRGLAVLVASAALFASSSAYAASGVSVTTNPSVGHGILTDERGMTLYRYTPDQGGTSVCYDACALAWPPVLVDALPPTQDGSVASKLGLTPRSDGTQQLTYNNQPLYYYVGDTNPGDANGQASDGVWFVVDGPNG